MTTIDLPGADSAAVRAAHAVAERYLSPALLQHSIRSWRFALAFADVDGVGPIDAELLHVAALLHDIGLVPEFDAVRVPFESAGGHVAWVLSAGAGWEPRRRDRVVQVIERHMLPAVDRTDDPEGYLLEVATGLDISGARVDALPAELLRDVVGAHPRGDLALQFGRCLADQATRKPGSQAARIIAAGLQRRLDSHPLEGS